MSAKSMMDFSRVAIFLFILLTDNVSHGHASTVDAVADHWEDVHLICPEQCVCKNAPIMDLSISRWIEGLKTIPTRNAKVDMENEAYYEHENSDNVLMKFIMCMLQSNRDFSDLVNSLPDDVQALVLLFNGDASSNYTIRTSDLAAFADLTTLEVRGTESNHDLVFLINEPLPGLKHANFEAVKLMADEKLNALHVSSRHPSETYEYIPDSERESYNTSVELNHEVEIVPYDVYRMEVERSKRATFVGWNQLEVLRIHYCQFDEINWEMFDELSCLRHLSLEHNGIKIVPPFAFYGAMHISTLSLAHNSILELNYRSLAGLLELEYLDLSSNNLTKLSETTFPPFPNLKTADLQRNAVQFIFPMTFAIMNATKELMIGSEEKNVLDLSFGSGAFASLDQLEFLSLNNVFIAQLHQRIFAGMKNLERLHIGGSIGSIEFDAFAEMTRIRELKLSNCGLMEISMDAFFGVRDLRVIDLSHNALSEIPPGIFDDQNRLQEIYLQDNLLTKLPARFFDHPTLKLVRLTGNPFVCNCDMAHWKQSVTNVERGKRMSSPIGQRCWAKGKIAGFCDENGENSDDFPRWLYEFDNRLSPRCDGGPKKVMHQSVYYALRRTIKCLRPQDPNKRKFTSYQIEKQRRQSKKSLSALKMAELAKIMGDERENAESQENIDPVLRQKTNRRMTFDAKVQRTIQQREKHLRWSAQTKQ